MALPYAATAPTREADLERLVDSLVHPDAPLNERIIDALADRVIASGDPGLAGRLILMIHGRGALTRARALADRCVQHFPSDSSLARIRRLVAPPRVVPNPPHARIDRRPDFEWLAKHAGDYPGEWLVVSGGRLWAHSKVLAEAEEQAKTAGLAERPLLYHVETQ